MKHILLQLVIITALAASVPVCLAEEGQLIKQSDADATYCVSANAVRDRYDQGCLVDPLLGSPLDRSEPDTD